MRVIRNTSVCVVGGAGFLGSHMVRHLTGDRGCRVLVLDNLVTGRREFLDDVPPGSVHFEHCDITHSEERMTALFREHRVQYVFNYAAYPYIPVSFKRPLTVIDVNMMGAVKVINAAQDAGARGILQVSSAEIYGGIDRIGEWEMNDHDPKNVQVVHLSESAKVCPHSSYGVSKAAVDAYCQVAWRERQTPVLALRQFNCVGERETHPYVIPEILEQLQLCDWRDGSPRPIVRLGNNSYRDFMYAGDAVAMAAELLEKGAFGEVYNLGSQSAVRIYDLAKMIGEVMEFEDVRVEFDPARKRPWEIWSLLSDNTRIHNTIERRPKVALIDALRKTYDWYCEAGFQWPW